MLKKLSDAWKSMVSRFLIKSEKKIIGIWSKLTGQNENYIKDELYNSKRLEFISFIFNIIVTGTIIWFFINFTNNPLSYGLIAYLAQYYVGWTIDKIRERTED